MADDLIRIGVDFKDADDATKPRHLGAGLHHLINAYLIKIGADPVQVEVKEEAGGLIIQINQIDPEIAAIMKRAANG